MIVALPGLFSFLFFQIAIEPFALFHHSVFDHMCFTVIFQDEVKYLSADRTYICNLELHASKLRVKHETTDAQT